jgi:hypothetical protein
MRQIAREFGGIINELWLTNIIEKGFDPSFIWQICIMKCREVIRFSVDKLFSNQTALSLFRETYKLSIRYWDYLLSFSWIAKCQEIGWVSVETRSCFQNNAEYTFNLSFRFSNSLNSDKSRPLHKTEQNPWIFPHSKSPLILFLSSSPIISWFIWQILFISAAFVIAFECSIF